MSREDDHFWDAFGQVFLDDWRDYSACANVDPDIFENSEREDEAKKICAVCPVGIECLDDALYHSDPFFVRGGLTEDERITVFLHRKRYQPQFKADVAPIVARVQGYEAQMYSL